MAFMSLEIFFFRKKKQFFFKFAYFFPFFFYLLPSFNKKRSHNTLSVFTGVAIEFILGAKVRLYSFECVLWQVVTDFWFVVCLLFLCKHIKIEYQQFLIPYLRTTGNCKPMGNFSWFLMVFITLKLIVFIKMSEFFNFTVFVLYCLIVTKL